MTDLELIKEAILARENSYSPYSEFMVGAALECKDGTIFKGCNVENAAYSPTNCAERSAIFAAVSMGHREFTRIAIVGGPKDADLLTECFPCGVCRQVMHEFVDDSSFTILTAEVELSSKKISPKSYRLSELLPHAF